jgi:hypothetical protein
MGQYFAVVVNYLHFVGIGTDMLFGPCSYDWNSKNK